MSHYLDSLAFKLERQLISSEHWTDEVINKFPTEYHHQLRHPELYGPIGLGFDEEVGWFILASGQGPFIVWTEKPIK